MPAIALEGRTISLRTGDRPSVVAANAWASGPIRCVRSFSVRASKSVTPAPGRVRSAGPDAHREPAVIRRPQPTRAGSRDRDPRGNTPRTNDHAPVRTRRGRPRLVRPVEYPPRRSARHRPAGRIGFHPDERLDPRTGRTFAQAWSETRPELCWRLFAAASSLRTASPARPGQGPEGAVPTSRSSCSKVAINSWRRILSPGASRSS